MLDKCSMTPVEALAQTDKRSQDTQRVPLTGLELHNFRILLLRGLFPVKTGNVGHERNLFLIEPQQFGIFDNII